MQGVVRRADASGEVGERGPDVRQEMERTGLEAEGDLHHSRERGKKGFDMHDDDGGDDEENFFAVCLSKLPIGDV
jgi:hypothetical protein